MLLTVWSLEDLGRISKTGWVVEAGPTCGQFFLIIASDYEIAKKCEFGGFNLVLR